MNCAACGHANADDANFCENCAADLVRTCGSCGTENSPTAKFCKRCRASLTADAPVAGATSNGHAPAVRDLPTSFGSGRYEVDSFLGEGGRKRVYLAHDTKLDRDVAFAVIKIDGLDVDGLARVQREAQAMGRLGDHPNIVTVFDTGDEEAQPYIVSQYMAGGDLAATLQHRDDHRLPIEQAMRIAEQVCAGLEHAHARGIVHRDLKPGNIWFDGPGVAQIGDFGLAVALDRSRLTMAGMMVGTASYMPPEQAMGGETTPASDLYALGCMLYEMVTGRPPFVGDDTVAVISQHVNTPPVAPTWHNAECPPALETLILRLLEKDAKKRPSSAAQVREALGSASRGSTPSPHNQASTHRRPIRRTRSTGARSSAASKRSGNWRRRSTARSPGQGSLLMIVGEPGIGKTTITEQLATYVGMRGGTSLVGHCYEEGSLSLPYLPFVEAMRSYVVKQDHEQLSQQLGSGAADVARIVSEVRDRVTVEAVGDDEPGGGALPALPGGRGLPAERIGRAGALPRAGGPARRRQGHDGDARAPRAQPVRARASCSSAHIATSRSTARTRSRRRSLNCGASRASSASRCAASARTKCSGCSPTSPARKCMYVLAEAVYRQTEGNPLFIQEVIRYAAESGLIKREGDQWVATGGPESLITQIPEGLKDVIGRRSTGLSEECNRVLSVASVIGRDFAVDVLQRVGGITEDELLTALEEAMRVSLIEEMKGGREAALPVHARLLPADAVRRDDRAAPPAHAQRSREGAGAALRGPAGGARGGTRRALRPLVHRGRPAQGCEVRRTGGRAERALSTPSARPRASRAGARGAGDLDPDRHREARTRTVSMSLSAALLRGESQSASSARSRPASVRTRRVARRGRSGCPHRRDRRSIATLIISTASFAFRPAGISVAGATCIDRHAAPGSRERVVADDLALVDRTG